MIDTLASHQLLRHFRDRVVRNGYGSAIVVKRGDTTALFLEVTHRDRLDLPILLRYNRVRLIFTNGILRRILLEDPKRKALDRVDLPFHAFTN